MRRAWRTGGGRRMPEAQWKPHVTVAALCERDGKFLLVREKADGGIVYNQPAGHLEAGESLVDAVIRETLEETRYVFTPTAMQKIYRYLPEQTSQRSYMRFLFRGELGQSDDGQLDEDILSVEWMSYDEVLACRKQHRSPLVLQSIEDYRAGPGYPLSLISPEFS